MTDNEIQTFRDLADAYRILREAYHADMHRELPAKNTIQYRAETVLAAYAEQAAP